MITKESFMWYEKAEKTLDSYLAVTFESSPPEYRA